MQSPCGDGARRSHWLARVRINECMRDMRTNGSLLRTESHKRIVWRVLLFHYTHAIKPTTRRQIRRQSDEYWTAIQPRRLEKQRRCWKLQIQNTKSYAKHIVTHKSLVIRSQHDLFSYNSGLSLDLTSDQLQFSTIICRWFNYHMIYQCLSLQLATSVGA